MTSPSEINRETVLQPEKRFPNADIADIRFQDQAPTRFLQPKTIDDPSQVLLRLSAGDAVAVALTFLAPPWHEDIESGP